MSVELLKRSLSILMNGVSDLNESVQVAPDLLHHPLMLIFLLKSLLNILISLLFFLNSCFLNFLHTILFHIFDYLLWYISFFIVDFFGCKFFFRGDLRIFFTFWISWLFWFCNNLFLVLDLFNLLFSGLFSFRCHIVYY